MLANATALEAFSVQLVAVLVLPSLPVRIDFWNESEHLQQRGARATTVLVGLGLDPLQGIWRESIFST